MVAELESNFTLTRDKLKSALNNWTLQPEELQRFLQVYKDKGSSELK